MFITEQTTDYNCGPTVLSAVLNHFNIAVSPDEISNNLRYFTEEHGTFITCLGMYALEKNLDATIYTYDLDVFDLTWNNGTDELLYHLNKMLLKCNTEDEMKRLAIQYYIEFLKNGGHIEICPDFNFTFNNIFSKERAVIAGVSSQILYRGSRINDNGDYDIYGKQEGHFIIAEPAVNASYMGIVDISDPYGLKSKYGKLNYSITFDTFVQAVLQSTHTHDGAWLEITKQKE